MNGYILLVLCAIVMISLMQVRRKIYGLSAWRALMFTLPVAALGFFGTYLMYYIENLEFGGQSFFGAILFFPILLMPIARLFRMPLESVLDYATPAGFALLIPFKLNCYLGGCCGGKAIWFTTDGVPIHFPSQMVEMATAVVIAGVLFYAEQKNRKKGIVYPLCLIIYGITRLILNQFRGEYSIYVFNMTAGSFWSVVSIAIGIIWFCIIPRREKNKGG